MTRELTFATGLVTYTVNGGAQITFNPTDETFIKRFYECFDALDSMQADFERSSSSAEGFDGSLAVFSDFDVRIRELLDGLFGDGTCKALFGEMNSFALADGLPLWANFMLAIADEIAERFDDEHGRTQARMNEHNGKYDAMLAKYRNAPNRQQSQGVR